VARAAIGIEKCQIRAATTRLYARPAVVLAVHGSPRGTECNSRPNIRPMRQNNRPLIPRVGGSCTAAPDAGLGQLIETIAWDGSTGRR